MDLATSADGHRQATSIFSRREWRLIFENPIWNPPAGRHRRTASVPIPIPPRSRHQVHIISEAFACDLGSRGYATSTIDLYGRIVAHFGRWLSQRQVARRQIRPTMWTGFSCSICPAVSASHRRSAAFPSVEVRCMVFWISYVDVASSLNARSSNAPATARLLLSCALNRSAFSTLTIL